MDQIQIDRIGASIAAANCEHKLLNTQYELEAAKQRERELLAVIETMRKSVGMVISAVDGGVTHMIKDSLGETLLKEAFALSEEPSQALREHEAKVLEEAAARLTECGSIIGYPEDELLRMAEERRKK